MADLAAAHDTALENVTVQNNAASDAVSEREHDDIAEVLARAGDRLAHRGAVSVVCDAHRARNNLAELLHKRNILPADIVRVDNLSGSPVDRSRDTDTDADALVERHVLLLQEIKRLLRDLVDDFLCRALRLRREGLRRNQLILVIHETDLSL